MSRSVRTYFSILFLLLIFTCVTGYTAFIQDSTKVDCGGQEMQEGDTCEHTKNGRTTASNDYETEKQNQENAKLWSTIGFFPLVLGSIGWLGFGVYAVSKGKRQPQSARYASPNVYANNYPPQAGGYPPAGNYPPPNNYPPAGNYPPPGGGYPPANQYPPQGHYPPPNNQR